MRYFRRHPTQIARTNRIAAKTSPQARSRSGTNACWTVAEPTACIMAYSNTIWMASMALPMPTEPVAVSSGTKPVQP